MITEETTPTLQARTRNPVQIFPKALPSIVALVGAEGYGDAGRAALDELAASIDDLSTTLLEHLDYEESAIGPALDAHGFA